MILQCQNEGCQSGRSFEIDPKQAAWFEERGLSLPKSCPSCRDWKRAQKDEISTCSMCKAKKRITDRQKIGFHRYKGVWVTPTLCRICELHPERAERQAQRAKNKGLIEELVQQKGKKAKQEKPWKEDNYERLFKRLDVQTEVYSLPILANPLSYAKIYHKEDGNVRNHIIRHLSELEGAYRVKGEEVVFNVMKIAANSSDPGRILEFVQVEDGRIVKYDQKSKVVLVLDKYESPPPSHRLVTAFPKTIGAILKKLVDGRWKPQKKGRVI